MGNAAASDVKIGMAMRLLCDGPALLSTLESLSDLAYRRFGTNRFDLLVTAAEDSVDLTLLDGDDPVRATVPAVVQRRGSAIVPTSELLELLRQVVTRDVGLGSSHGPERRLQLRANGRTYLLSPVPTRQVAPTSIDPADAASSAEPVDGLPVLSPRRQPGEYEPEVLGARGDSSDPERDHWPAVTATRPDARGWRRTPRLVVPRGHRVVLGVAVSLLFVTVGSLPLPHAVRALALIGAAAVASLVPYLRARTRADGDLLALGVFVGFAYLLLFPARALVVLLDLDTLENVRVDSASFADVRLALAVGAIGILAGSLGYLAPVGARLGERVRLPRIRIAEVPGPVLPVAAFGFGFAAQVMLLTGERVQSVDAILAGRSSGIVSGSSVMMLVGLALLTRRAALTHNPWAARMLVAAVAAGLLASLIGQFKEVAVLSVGTPLLVWPLTTGIRLSRIHILIAGGILLTMFAAVSVWRHASNRVASANPTTVAAAFPEQATEFDWTSGGKRPLRPWSPLGETASLVSHRLYGYDSLALAVRYTPSDVPHQNGATLANLASGLVPRILWPSKPFVGIGYWFARSYWGTPSGVAEVPQSVTHIGELWIDFGWFGVIIGMTILGVWYRLVYSALRPRASGTGAVVYAIVFLTVLPVDRDLPLVYVTLVQRLAFVALLFGAAAIVTRALDHRRT